MLPGCFVAQHKIRRTNMALFSDYTGLFSDYTEVFSKCTGFFLNITHGCSQSVKGMLRTYTLVVREGGVRCEYTHTALLNTVARHFDHHGICLLDSELPDK